MGQKEGTGKASGGLIAVAVVLGIVVLGGVGMIVMRGGKVGSEEAAEEAVQMDLLGTPEGKPGPAGQPTQPTNSSMTGPEDLLGATH